MKIQCQSCQAKYTIADEKVLGKVVKIRCKKCSSTIVINGNETRPAEDNQDTNVFDYAGQANDQWTVNVADGDQRTMTGQEIVAEYRTGVVGDETYCWKDGMADWLPLREIEQLFGAVKLAPAGRGIAHSLHDGEFGDAPQSIPPAGNAGALFSPNEAAAAVESPFAGGGAGGGAGGANGNGNGYHAPDAAYAAPVAASAARRGGGRGQGADLFGNVASAGGEEEVMTSAPTGGAAMHGAGGGGMEEQKLTGQRNESSVLFSLSALTEGGKAESAAAQNRTTATSDGSGLIDIRALSQTMGSDDKKDTNARVDDIMNLSGGGAFGAALAAPILAPPPLEMSHDAYGAHGGGQKSNKMLFIAIIAGAAMIAIGIVVAVIVARPSVAPIDATNPAATVSGLAAAATGTGALAANDPNTAPTAAVTAPAPTADNTPPPPGTGNASGKTPAVTGATHAATGGGGGTHAAAQAEPTPPPVHTAEPPKDFAGALAAAAGKPKEAPAETGGGGGSTAPFDRGAAAGALGSVNVQACKKPDGPTGGGHVTITFSPNGSVSSAVVDQGPFPGTSVGGCIAGKFRSAHIPAFAGGSVKAGKSFTIN